MTGKIRIPGDLNVPIQLFGQFTVKELIRLTVPVLIGLSFRSVTWIVAGMLAGIVWYLWKPFGQPLDYHVRHLPRWLFGKRQLQESDLGDLESQMGRSIDNHKIKNKHGSLIGVIEVTPTNLDLKTGDENAALHNVYQQLLESVNYPVQILSKQTAFEIEDYLRKLEKRSGPHKVLKKDYMRYCHEIGETELEQTQHYIVVHVEPGGLNYVQKHVEKALSILPGDLEKWCEPWLGSSNDAEGEERALAAELDSRCREVVTELNTADLSAERVTDADRLKELVKESIVFQRSMTPVWTGQPSERGGQYKRSLYISEYPSTVQFGWINQVLQSTGKIDIAQTVRPRNTSDAVKQLQQLSEKLNAEINSFLASGYMGTNKLESLLEDVEWFLDLLAERQGKPVEYGCYITVRADSRERCRQVFDQVCNRLDTMRFDYEVPVLRTDYAYKSMTPLYLDCLNESLLMPASSAASGFPFTTQQSTGFGVLHGLDTGSGAPVLLNRFDWSSHSLARMGMVGSGKSYKSKLELLRSQLVHDDLQVVVVDPKQEYRRIIEICQGEYRVLNGETEVRFDNDVVGYTIPERGDENNVRLLVDGVRQIYHKTSQNEQKTLVLIDEARILLNDEHGLDVLNQFVLEGRDTNTAVTLVTQNASHFTYSRKGREILDNMPAKEFMRHDRVPESAVNYFDMSRREKQELYELKTGTESRYSESLLRVSGRLKTRVKIESTSQEHVAIDSPEVEA